MPKARTLDSTAWLMTQVALLTEALQERAHAARTSTAPIEPVVVTTTWAGLVVVAAIAVKIPRRDDEPEPVIDWLANRSMYSLR